MITPSHPKKNPHQPPDRFFDLPIALPTTIGRTQKTTAKARISIQAERESNRTYRQPATTREPRLRIEERELESSVPN
jgi:hypothetical protein